MSATEVVAEKEIEKMMHGETSSAISFLIVSRAIRIHIFRRGKYFCVREGGG